MAKAIMIATITKYATRIGIMIRIRTKIETAIETATAITTGIAATKFAAITSATTMAIAMIIQAGARERKRVGAIATCLRARLRSTDAETMIAAFTATTMATMTAMTFVALRSITPLRLCVQWHAL